MFAVDFRYLDDRYVEGTAAKVEHGDLLVAALLVHAIGERCRRRLVDDALDVEARDLAGVLRRLALRVVEVRRHRDDGFRDFFAEVVFGGLLHLHEDACRDFRRRHLVADGLDPGVAVVGLDDVVRHHLDVALHDVVFEPAADEALHREKGVRRIRNGLAFRRLADEDLVVLAERDDRRRCAIAFTVFDDLRRIAFHDGDTRVRRAEVNSYYFSH